MKKIIRNSVVMTSLLMTPMMVTVPSTAAAEPATVKAHAGLTTVEIDQLVERVMQTYQVPGIAVGIIKDGKVIHAKGYGVRNITKKGDVTAETLFSIASTGKSMTAAALALLVDEGKITWKDKVIDHIPDFRLYDPWVTREFTVKDLLIHNSGLGIGAGDLMMFPSQDFSRAEIIANLRHLKPVSSFRSEFAYDNLLYIVAGEVIARVSGMTYEDFIEQRILKPLEMSHCGANLKRLKKEKNVADPHMVRNGKLQATIRDVPLGQPVVFAAAGGIQCSVESILKWHDMHLHKGKLPNGAVFLSEEQQAELLTPQTITAVRPTSRDWFGSHFSAYGLGWGLSDFKGYKMAQHGGGLLGMLSDNVMIPDLNLGVVVYTNQQAGVARPAIVNSILEAYTSENRTDWIPRLSDMLDKRRAKAAKVTADITDQSDRPAGPFPQYVGIYQDPWFGKVEISQTPDGLYFTAARSARLKGSMVPYKKDLFIVRWEDRSLEADAYVKFTTDYSAQPRGITMKAVSPLTDFSFDFHDLNFQRIDD
ncbi:serine hydrolase [Paremcibacter congregatus]|uniref:serine hydrolase n=1 Tax=Paremcibacter congregatus TaxID=2043170 RepID=UPI003A8F74E8